MSPLTIFRIDLALGYLAWGLVVANYIWPRVKVMDRVEALRAITTFNSFRFFGLVFLLPGFVGPNLPQGFAVQVAYGDLATGLLALLALLTIRRRALFWPFVWAFNLVGFVDLLMATTNAIRFHVPEVAGQLGAAYAIPILYVPGLFFMHLVAFRLLLGPLRATVSSAGVTTLVAATK